jgi:hypothetical protein
MATVNGRRNRRLLEMSNTGPAVVASTYINGTSEISTSTYVIRQVRYYLSVLAPRQTEARERQRATARINLKISHLIPLWND